MAAKTFIFNINAVTILDEGIMRWYSSGLYCRT